MERFRLVVLDYPKLILDSDKVKRYLGDLLQARQLNYTRTSDKFVTMDQHDMIGTHILVYDTTELFNPQLVFGYRLCYQDRAKAHNIPFTMDQCKMGMPQQLIDKLNQFEKTVGPLVHGNLAHLNSNYLSSKVPFPIMKMGIWASVVHLLRCGYDNYVGLTNEKYKVSRYIEHTGPYEKGLIYPHPDVQDLHQLFMMSSFNSLWLKEGFLEFRKLWENRIEVIHPSLSGQQHNNVTELFTQKRMPPIAKKAA